MKLLISVSGSDILYHITGTNAATKIVQQDKFHLKPNEGTDAEQGLTKAAYYLSCARSPQSSYFAQKVYQYSVIFVLDGRALGNRYKIQPVDYWGTLVDAEPYDSDNAYVKRKVRNEKEDRLLSPTATIPAMQYVKAIHVMINDKRDKLFQLKKAGLLRKIPVYFYDDTKDFLLLDKRKARKMEFTKADTQPQSVPMREYEFKYRLRKNSIKPWIELYYAKLPTNIESTYAYAKERLTKEAFDVYRRIEYSDALNGFNADLHNAKGSDLGHVSKEREMLDTLIKIMRKDKVTPAQFIEKMRAKWYPRPKR